jgi:hypothetical protein
MKLLSLLEELILESKLKEVDGEESDTNPELKSVINIGLVFDSEEDRNNAFNWLSDISNYPSDVTTQSSRGGGGKGTFTKVYKGTDFDSPENYIKFTKGELTGIESRNDWDAFKFGPSNAKKRSSLEKQIQAIDPSFKFPVKMGPASPQGKEYEKEFLAQKSGGKIRVPIKFDKKDKLGIEFPAEENAGLGFNKNRLTKLVKFLSDKMMGTYFNEITSFKY